jgi:ABC-type uncharacterized transport system ATPase subunit
LVECLEIVETSKSVKFIISIENILKGVVFPRQGCYSCKNSIPTPQTVAFSQHQNAKFGGRQGYCWDEGAPIRTDFASIFVYISTV